MPLFDEPSRRVLREELQLIEEAVLERVMNRVHTQFKEIAEDVVQRAYREQITDTNAALAKHLAAVIELMAKREIQR